MIGGIFHNSYPYTYPSSILPCGNARFRFSANPMNLSYLLCKPTCNVFFPRVLRSIHVFAPIPHLVISSCQVHWHFVDTLPSVILSLNLRLLHVLRLGLESFLRCHIRPFCFSEGKISSSALLEDWGVSSPQRHYSVYAVLSYTRVLSNMFIGDFASRRDDDDSPIPLRVLSLSSCLRTLF